MNTNNNGEKTECIYIEMRNYKMNEMNNVNNRMECSRMECQHVEKMIAQIYLVVERGRIQ